MNDEFFEKLKEKAAEYFSSSSGGHTFGHIERVYRGALELSVGEDVDMDVVRAATLLHDIARSKESKGSSICHAEEGARMAGGILERMGFPDEKIPKVVYAIQVHRYSHGIEAETREAMILQDADRLDALGAIILVRMIKSAGKHGRLIYDPSIPVMEKYDGTKTNVINHIHEKILKITPESFNTPRAREIAKGRYDFVKDFAERYVKEVNGEW